MSYYSETKRNFAIVAIALILIGVLLCGIITEGFREWNPYCWFGHAYGEDGICAKCGAEKPVEEPPVEEPDENLDDNLAFAPIKGQGLSIRRVATNPSNAQSVTLVATTEPADMQDVVLKWSIAWKNASSSWATGKAVSDYVEMSANGLQDWYH